MLKVYSKPDKVLLNSCLFLRNLLCRHWLFFERPSEKKSPNFEMFPAQCPKKRMLYGSYWSFAFLKKILWTRETQFLKRCKNQKISRSNSETKYNHFCQKIYLFQKLFGRRKLYFESLLQKTTAENRNFYA